MTIKKFIEAVSEVRDELYLMSCSELVVFDRRNGVVYIPEATHNNANMNPMGDFRTILGHGLLWSRHVELDGTSEDLRLALSDAGYTSETYDSQPRFCIYSLMPPNANKSSLDESISA